MGRALLVVAGEASADRAAAAVIGPLLERSPGLKVFGVAGPELRGLGVEVVAPAEVFSVVGITEVRRALPGIALATARLLRAAWVYRPHAALLVDLPDFNARLGPLLRRLLGLRILYMGAPQAWAWRPGRAGKMARWVDVLACFFPFEPVFFTERGVRRAIFVGHPRVAAARRAREVEAERDAIVLMPGSRWSELGHHAPTLRAALPMLLERFPEMEVVVPVAPTLDVSAVRERLGPAARDPRVTLMEGDALDALGRAKVALCASGTAVTEALLMRTPTVAFYRLSGVSYAIARRLARVSYVAMTNILAGESVVEELVQEAFTPEGLVEAAARLLEDGEGWRRQRERMEALAQSLEAEGDAGERVARLLEGWLR